MGSSSLGRTEWPLGCQLCLAIICLTGAGQGMASSVLPGEVSVGSGVTLTMDYSDNISLGGEGPGSDLVLQAAPGFNFSVTGRRTNLTLDYSLRALKYLELSEADDLRHQLSAGADFEIFQDILSIDAKASAGTRVTNPALGVGVDDLNATDSFQQTWSIGLNPKLSLRHGSFARSDLHVRADALTIGNRTDSGSTGWGITYSLTGGEEFANLPWSVSYNRDHVANRGAENDASEQLGARIGRRFTSRWGLNLEVGWEKNRSGRGYQAGSGLVLGATLNWTPNPRTNASLTVGRRSFGDTYALALNHKSRRTVIGIKYSESLSSFRSNVLEADFGGPEEIFGLAAQDVEQAGTLIASGILSTAAPGLPPESVQAVEDLVALLGQDLPGQDASAADLAFESLLPETGTQSSNVFLQRRVSIAYGLNTGRTSIGTSFNAVWRDSGSRGGTSDSMSVALNLGRRLGGNTSAKLGVTWTDRAGNAESRDLRVTAALSRQLSRHVSASLRYGHARRSGDSESAQGGYHENRLTFALASKW
jgi:hypothetical protein